MGDSSPFNALVLDDGSGQCRITLAPDAGHAGKARLRVDYVHNSAEVVLNPNGLAQLGIACLIAAKVGTARVPDRAGPSGVLVDFQEQHPDGGAHG